MHVRTAIAHLLEATAEQTALKVRIDRLRADLEAEAKRRYADDGAAPTWKAPGLGTVRLDPPSDTPAPRVADPDAFASWLAEHRPDAIDAQIHVPLPQLEAALDALRFAGVEPVIAELVPDVYVTRDLLAALTVVVDEVPPDEFERTQQITASYVAPVTGEIVTVPGIGVAPPAAPRFVVTLDKARRKELIEEAEARLEVDEADDRVADEVAEETTAGEVRQLVTLGEAILDAMDAPRDANGERVATDLTPEEAATVERFESAPDPFDVNLETEPLTPERDAELEQITARQAEADVTAAAVLNPPAEPAIDPVEDTTIGLEVDAGPVNAGLATNAEAARDAARKILRDLAASPTAWESAKADDLHRYAQLADLGISRGRIAKAALLHEVLAGLTRLDDADQ